MPSPAVIDTNVVVGGLQTHAPDSPFASVLTPSAFVTLLGS